mmetsp:Transcript_15582/g.21328  ORF Transcript_15582/g.21328 Transcript_15582/m.21328 type:complete len:680 (+) Transcript_15582:399-2438(+)
MCCSRVDATSTQIICMVCAQCLSPDDKSLSNGNHECTKCKTIQPVGELSPVSSCIKSFCSDLQTGFTECIVALGEKIIFATEGICGVCDGNYDRDDDDDDNDDDFDHERNFDDLVSTSENTSSRYRSWRNICIGLDALRGTSKVHCLMDFPFHYDRFSARVLILLESLIKQAKKIEGTIDSISGTDLNLVERSLSNLRVCKSLLPSKCFSPFKNDYRSLNRKYAETIKTLHKSQDDAINRHDLEKLVDMRHNNTIIAALLQSQFVKFTESVSTGTDLLLSINLVSKECHSWYRFFPVDTEVVLKKLVENYCGLLTRSAGGLNHLQRTELTFFHSNFHVLVAFLTCTEKLKKDVKVLGDDPSLQHAVKKTKECLNSVVSFFHKITVDIDSILSNFEVNIPKIPESAFTSTVVLNVNDLIRFQNMWKEISDHEEEFWLISSLNHLAVNEKRLSYIQSLKTVPKRLSDIKCRSMQLINLPFNNIKTNTQNKTDKDAFFSLIYVSYRFLLSLSTADVTEQITKQVRMQLDVVSDSCLKYIDSMKATTVEEFFVIHFQVKAFEITKRFEEKINAMLDDAMISEGQWNDWLKHIDSLCKQLILLKSISRNVPSFRAFIDNGTADLLAKYQSRCDTEEIANDFIARLGTILQSSPSNGLGQKIIEDNPIFSGYRNLLRNLQFERVP